VQVGSRIDFVAQFLGRRLAYTYEVIDFVPGRHLTMRTPSGFSARLAPLMSFMVGWANRKDLALLKQRLER
jgi:hypothetical protein